MNACQIYKTALEVMAAKGNVDAQFALSVGSQAELDSCNPSDEEFAYTNKLVAQVTSYATIASDKLAEARNANACSWTSRTDTYIESARETLTKMLAFLATN